MHPWLVKSPGTDLLDLSAGMNGQAEATGRKSVVASGGPRRQSGVLQENGRKDSVAGQALPATKNGRLSQVR